MEVPRLPEESFETQLEREMEDGRGAPTSPPDPRCKNCGGDGIDRRTSFNLYCECRYR